MRRSKFHRIPNDKKPRYAARLFSKLRPLLGANRAKLAVAHQAPPLLVPEPEGEGFETGKQRDGLHGLKQRLGAVTLFQMVVGNPRAEVMDVMKANVAGKPLEHFGQLVE